MFNNIAAELDGGAAGATVGVEDFPFGRLDLRAGYGEMVSPDLYLGVEFAFTLLNNVSGTVSREQAGGEQVNIDLEADTGFAAEGGRRPSGHADHLALRYRRLSTARL